MMSGSVFTRKGILQVPVAVLALSLSGLAYGATPICQNTNADLDRDGWGWENNRSCIVDGNSTDNFASTRTRNICQYRSSDDDGDGFGWEDNDTCIVGDTSSGGAPAATNTTPPDRVTAASNSDKPACQSSSADPDGDGYGWENNRSCIVDGSSSSGNTQSSSSNNNSKPSCVSRNADPDGDGYGWENNRSCVVDASSTSNNSSGNTSSSSNTGTSSGTEIYSAADITDLLLITGQSNTLGAGTSINNSLDSSHKRVFAYTDEGWRVAELYQTWDRGSHPGNGDSNSSASKRHNNFALHLGKRLATLNSNRVVGFILVSEPGEGISHWDSGAAGMQRVRSKVLAAINELSHKSVLDGIIWHQGETDWLREGTSDPGVPQPAAKNYYSQKLTALIRNFRSENWYNSSKPFICGETIAATGVNSHLMALNTDSDSRTSCVEGYGLPSRDDGNHFNASGLRTIGKRYADRYFEITGQ